MKRIFTLFCILILTAVLCGACNLFISDEPVPTQPQTEAEVEATVAPATEPATEPPVTEAPTEIFDDALSGYIKIAKEKTLEYSSGHTHTFCLPEVTFDTQDARDANSEIMDDFGEMMENLTTTSGYSLEYEAYLNEDVLSLVIFVRYDGGSGFGLGYNFDVTTGDRIDDETLCSIIGKSYDDVLDELCDALDEHFEKKNLIGIDSRREQTYSDENLQAAILYLNDSADLMAMIDVYASVGGGHWIAQLQVD